MNKIISISEAANKVKSGMTLMIGGFMAAGTPERIIDEMVKTGVKDLTIICNDTAFPDKGIGKLVSNKQVKKLIVSHIGTNPCTVEQMNSGEIEVEFSPQGTLAERVRAGGAGLGGVLTPTGLGTVISQGKDIITIDDKQFLLERPLRADIALIGASFGDKTGNLTYRGTTQNFNPIMATASDIVIAEVETIVEVGEIAPENIRTQNIFVDWIVE